MSASTLYHPRPLSIPPPPSSLKMGAFGSYRWISHIVKGVATYTPWNDEMCSALYPLKWRNVQRLIPPEMIKCAAPYTPWNDERNVQRLITPEMMKCAAPYTPWNDEMCSVLYPLKWLNVQRLIQYVICLHVSSLKWWNVQRLIPPEMCLGPSSLLYDDDASNITNCSQWRRSNIC